MLNALNVDTHIATKSWVDGSQEGIYRETSLTRYLTDRPCFKKGCLYKESFDIIYCYFKMEENNVEEVLPSSRMLSYLFSIPSHKYHHNYRCLQ